MNGKKVFNIYDAIDIYDRIWEVIRTKVDDEVTCDYLADQIKDLMNEIIDIYEGHIENLKPELERLKAYDDEISKEMPLDFKDWWEGSKNEWPELARMCLEGRRETIEWYDKIVQEQDNEIEICEREIHDLKVKLKMYD